MAATAETTAVAAGLLKQAYNDEAITKVVPASSIIQEEVDFVPDGQKEGAQFNAPVLLSLPTGFTYGAGFASYQPIIPSNVQYAFLTGSNINLRDGIANDLISRAMNDKNSFMTASKYVMMALQKSMRKELELNLIYGSTGLGQVTATTSLSATSATLYFSFGTWAPAIWSGMENATIQFYNAGVQINGSTGLFTITAVTIAQQTPNFGGSITVTGASADITALLGASGVNYTFVNGATASTGAAIDVYMNTSFGNQMVGIKGILTATGTLFGLNTASYSVWQPNTFPCGSAPLSIGKVLDGGALAVARGAEDETLDVLINPNSYANLIVEASSARRLDGSWKKDTLANGARYIEYYGPNGKMRIIAHPFVKQGEGFILPLEDAKRIGSTDITFDLPGFAGPALYLPSPTNTGVEVRVFTSQALFMAKPSHCVFLQSIVPSTN
jgi:hypothetical protein